MSITIQCRHVTDAHPTIPITVDPTTDTVQSLLNTLSKTYKPETIKLVYRGAILSSPTATLQSLGIVKDGVAVVVVGQVLPPPELVCTDGAPLTETEIEKMLSDDVAYTYAIGAIQRNLHLMSSLRIQTKLWEVVYRTPPDHHHHSISKLLTGRPVASTLTTIPPHSLVAHPNVLELFPQIYTHIVNFQRGGDDIWRVLNKCSQVTDTVRMLCHRIRREPIGCPTDQQACTNPDIFLDMEIVPLLPLEVARQCLQFLSKTKLELAHSIVQKLFSRALDKKDSEGAILLEFVRTQGVVKMTQDMIKLIAKGLRPQQPSKGGKKQQQNSAPSPLFFTPVTSPYIHQSLTCAREYFFDPKSSCCAAVVDFWVENVLAFYLAKEEERLPHHALSILTSNTDDVTVLQGVCIDFILLSLDIITQPLPKGISKKFKSMMEEAINTNVWKKLTSLEVGHSCTSQQQLQLFDKLIRFVGKDIAIVDSVLKIMEGVCSSGTEDVDGLRCIVAITCIAYTIKCCTSPNKALILLLRTYLRVLVTLRGGLCWGTHSIARLLEGHSVLLNTSVRKEDMVAIWEDNEEASSVVGVEWMRLSDFVNRGMPNLAWSLILSRNVTWLTSNQDAVKTVLTYTPSTKPINPMWYEAIQYAITPAAGSGHDDQLRTLCQYIAFPSGVEPLRSVDVEAITSVAHSQHLQNEYYTWQRAVASVLGATTAITPAEVAADQYEKRLEVFMHIVQLGETTSTREFCESWLTNDINTQLLITKLVDVIEGVPFKAEFLKIIQFFTTVAKIPIAVTLKSKRSARILLDLALQGSSEAQCRMVELFEAQHTITNATTFSSVMVLRESADVIIGTKYNSVNELQWNDIIVQYAQSYRKDLKQKEREIAEQRELEVQSALQEEASKAKAQRRRLEEEAKMQQKLEEERRMLEEKVLARIEKQKYEDEKAREEARRIAQSRIAEQHLKQQDEEHRRLQHEQKKYMERKKYSEVTAKLHTGLIRAGIRTQEAARILSIVSQWKSLDDLRTPEDVVAAYLRGENDIERELTEEEFEGMQVENFWSTQNRRFPLPRGLCGPHSNVPDDSDLVLQQFPTQAFSRHDIEEDTAGSRISRKELVGRVCQDLFERRLQEDQEEAEEGEEALGSGVDASVVEEDSTTLVDDLLMLGILREEEKVSTSSSVSDKPVRYIHVTPLGHLYYKWLTI